MDKNRSGSITGEETKTILLVLTLPGRCNKLNLFKSVWFMEKCKGVRWERSGAARMKFETGWR